MFPRLFLGFQGAIKAACAGLLLLYAMSQYIELSYVIERDAQRNARPLENRSIEVAPSSFIETPVTRLLALEYQEGLLSLDGYEQALSVYAHAIASMRNQQGESQGITGSAHAQDFLSGVGQYIHTHYRYQAGLPLGQGLIDGALDCDMRVFLYLSLALSQGLDDFYFVIAPGHALVGWQAGTAKPLLWETTSGIGKIAELSNSRLYQPVASKRYGDYQLASVHSELLQSQLIASTAWALTKTNRDADKTQALALFERSLDVFPSANIAAAKVLIGSDDLVRDMPVSAAYAEYAAVYPNSRGAQLYQLSQLLALPEVQTQQDEIAQALAHGRELLAQGVTSPILDELFLRFGSLGDSLHILAAQPTAQRLGQALYPSHEFARAQDRVAEGRAFLIAAGYFMILGALFGMLVSAWLGVKNIKE